MHLRIEAVTSQHSSSWPDIAAPSAALSAALLAALVAALLHDGELLLMLTCQGRLLGARVPASNAALAAGTAWEQS